MSKPIWVTPEILLDPAEIQEEFFLAGGPGGQNVNKVATAVRLRFNVFESTALPPEVKERLLVLAGKKINARGELVIEVRQYRTQEQNRKAALERLQALIQAATRRPRPRRKTRPSAAVQQRRLAEKKRRSEIKRLRRSRFTEE